MKSVAAAVLAMASVAAAVPGASAPVTPSAATTPAQMTTKTIYDTQTHTVTSCAPTVTNCPAGPHVTVVTVPVTTTVCPVTQDFSVSTVYQTQTYVVTKCPATVTNCPVGKTTTEVVPTVTVCPVTSAPSGPKSTNAPVVPGQTKTVISGPVGSNSTAGVAQPTGGAANPTTSGKPSGPISMATSASVSSFLAAAGVAVALFQLC